MARAEAQSLKQSPAAAREQSNTWDLKDAIRAGKRLAKYRRRLTTLMALVAAPVFMLERSTNPDVRQVLTVLALVWVSLLLPMIRLLCLEWRNRRQVDDLHTLVH